MNAHDFIARTNIAFVTHERQSGEQRRGQFMFNTLYSWHPHLANALRGSRLDPFHNDDVLPDFYNFVTENWNNYERPGNDTE